MVCLQTAAVVALAKTSPAGPTELSSVGRTLGYVSSKENLFAEQLLFFGKTTPWFFGAPAMDPCILSFARPFACPRPCLSVHGQQVEEKPVGFLLRDKGKVFAYERISRKHAQLQAVAEVSVCTSCCVCVSVSL
jgi:hypothetical protein